MNTPLLSGLLPLLLAAAPAFGQSWEGLGASLEGGGISQTALSSWTPSLGVDPDGRPSVAWTELTAPTTRNIFFARLEGGHWTGLGGSTAGAGVSGHYDIPEYACEPALAFGTDGHPIIAWSDIINNNTQEIHARSWNGTSWVEIAGSASSGGISHTPGIKSHLPALAADANGNIAVAWREEARGIHVRVLAGSTWIELGGSATGFGLGAPTMQDWTQPSIALDADGRPIVAWTSKVSGGSAQIFVRRWTGTAWEGLGGSDAGLGLSNDAGRYSSLPQLRVDATGRPVVAWISGGGGSVAVYVRSWNPGPALWEELAGSGSGNGISGPPASDPDIQPNAVSLVLDRQGQPIVAWQKGKFGQGDVFLLRYRPGQGWMELGGSASGSGIGLPSAPSSAISAAYDSATGDILVSWSGRVAGNNSEIFLAAWFNQAPVAAAAPLQFRMDGVTPIPPGGITFGETGFVASGDFADPDGDRFLVEVEGGRVSGTAVTFAGRGDYTNASPATVGLSGALTLGSKYWWRIRAIDEGGAASAWTPFGLADVDEADLWARTNANPSLGPAGQFGTDGAPLPIGGKIFELESMSVQGSGGDSDGDDVRIEAEVRPVSGPDSGFRFEATGSGALVAVGATAVARFPAPGFPAHWQWRIVDCYGGASDWRSYGDNPETDPDLVGMPLGSQGSVNCGHATRGQVPVEAAVLLLLVLFAGRRT